MAADREEVQVAAVTVDGVPYKDGRGWYVPVEYELADGHKQSSRVGPSSTRKGGVAYVESLNSKAARGEVSARFRGGVFVGTISRYSIGGAK